MEGTWVLGMIDINVGIDTLNKRERRGGWYGLEICPEIKQKWQRCGYNRWRVSK